MGSIGDENTARLIAENILDAAQGDSIEAAISTACHLIYRHWDHPQGDPADPLGWAGAFHKLEDYRRSAPRIAVEMGSRIVHLLRGADRASHHAIYEALLTIRSERLSRAGLISSSTPTATSLLSQLVGNGRRLLDPACGVGGTLVAAALHADRDVIQGVDISAEAELIARERLVLATGRANGTVTNRDWLHARHTPAWDAIIAEPPVGGKVKDESLYERYGYRDSEVVWLEAILSSLLPYGRAAVITSAGLGHRGGEVGKWRTELIRSGSLAAIVALPGGSIFGTSIESMIWVIDRAATRDEVLLVNGLSAAPQQPTDAFSIDSIVNVCSQWLDEGIAPSTESWFAQTIAANRLVEIGAVTPVRHLGLPPVEELPRPAPPGTLFTELRLNNFKSISAPAAVALKPLTLVYGKNSSGKSSLLQAILLLKQSLAQNRISTSGPVTDLGSFTGILHKHDEFRPVEIGLSFNSAPELDAQSVIINPKFLRAVDITLRASGSTREGVVHSVAIKAGELALTWARTRSAFVIDATHAKFLVDTVNHPDTLWPAVMGSAMTEGIRVEQDLRRVSEELIEATVEGLLPGALSLQYLGALEARLQVALAGRTQRSGAPLSLNRSVAYVNSISSELTNLLDRTVYIGPLREPPSRVSRRNTSPQADVAFFLMDNVSEQDRVSQSLARLGMPYRLDAVSVSGRAEIGALGDLCALLLTDTRNGLQLSTADVGFGVSQVLPIVVELSSRTRTVLLIEQPEIHLHPAMQADLADLLIESVDENGAANQVIVETHSESLMLRLQRRIREGVLRASDVAVLYVDQDNDGAAIIRELRLDSEGDFIDNWPHGFFAERLDELFSDIL